MELTDMDLDIVTRYFNQTLSETDKQAFDLRLQTDVSFRQAVYAYQATSAVLNTVREREQKAFLKDIEASMPPVSRPIRTLNVRQWAVAAAFLLLATVGIWQYWSHDEQGVQMKSVAADYFEAYPALGITKGETSADIKTESLSVYAIKDYKKAIPLLQKAFETENDSLYLFYKSIALIANGQSEKAVPLLEGMQSSPSMPVTSVDWYLALAYIETTQNGKALLLLKKVADTEGGYQAKAQELMRKINE